MIKLTLNALTFALSISLLASVNAHADEQSLSSGNTIAEGCAEYDPNDARLPTGRGCSKPKDTIKYDPNCARLYGCSNQSPNQGPDNLTATEKEKKPFPMILPAVQQ